LLSGIKSAFYVFCPSSFIVTAILMAMQAFYAFFSVIFYGFTEVVANC